MNYLAHLYLAGRNEESMLGNILGDFVKGDVTGRYRPAICRGIWMHRQLDRFADDHPQTRSARHIISPARRRYAGIIIDICYDHFLAVHWGEFSDQPLQGFIREAYDLLQRHRDILPERLQRILPRMIAENWLDCYRTLKGVGLTLNRISKRIARQNPLQDAVVEIEDHYPELESRFLAFFPEAVAFAAQLRSNA